MSFVHRKKSTAFDYVNYVLLALISVCCIFPFFYVLVVSLTDRSVYVPYSFQWFPKKWSLEAYSYILSSNSFINALKSTVFITCCGTVLNLLFTFTMAYGLTEKRLPHRKLIYGLVVFSLVFSAGIIPSFLLVKQLGLMNSYWALILPALTNAWSLIVVKSFMDSLPHEVIESAKIDGCTDLGVFIRIILPLSKPALAAFLLFFAVSHWNTYFNAVMFLTDSKKWTLQVLVKSLVLDNSAKTAGMEASIGDSSPPSETVRSASIMLAVLPILFIYPFLQKHFAKGVMIGSVKG
ncbi:carbohydrate ABC transporter permease [Paenibacillus doosanensis]|uniref:L-arabinose transport system permease protein AraQ n=1 Tax=Paenibacillus konkukensis TaxID=2020716 RepID=A0ABY4RVX0_9BACL|nr:MULTISPECIES: carbohydrate ABC transporter permease [Paenibacillus]MCS7460301.1 carbohydrate ABC transporter permease [Paenibacillus doosanensis]UQZ86153.1 L-arabinose transport system permease protein AraQ [Paenibacillus konkukensis]